jgi:hypothetical protein
MLRSELLALVALGTLVGCNQIFGVQETGLNDAGVVSIDAPVPPDRDRDGLADPDDPCVASIADAKADYEGDNYLNESDGCPFDYESVDGDGDTLFDECDPLGMVAGDRVRCIMAFQNPVITRELWFPRAGDTAMWNIFGLSGISATGTGTLVIAEHTEAPMTTSYDLLVHTGPVMSPASEAAVTLWMRTNQMPSGSDVGCELRGNGSASTLTLLGAPSPTSAPIARAFSGSWKVQVTIEPGVSGRANVRCSTRPWAGTLNGTVKAEIALPPGTLGFGVEATSSVFAGLTVIERDDAPPL